MSDSVVVYAQFGNGQPSDGATESPDSKSPIPEEFQNPYTKASLQYLDLAIRAEAAEFHNSAEFDEVFSYYGGSVIDILEAIWEYVNKHDRGNYFEIDIGDGEVITGLICETRKVPEFLEDHEERLRTVIVFI